MIYRELFSERPEVLSAYGSGRWLFRYDIAETEDGWAANTVEVECITPTSAAVTRALIEGTFDPSYETKLINEYNMANLGLLTGSEAQAAVDNYLSYLNRRAALKSIVDTYFDGSTI